MSFPTVLACVFSLAILVPGFAYGHGGGLNAAGCHTNRKTGDYHSTATL